MTVKKENCQWQFSFFYDYNPLFGQTIGSAGLCILVLEAGFQLDILGIGVGVEATGLFLDDADGDVGAVVGNTLQVGQVIVEDEAHLDGALTALQALDMAGADFFDQTVDGLLQSFQRRALSTSSVAKAVKARSTILSMAARTTFSSA